MRIRFMHINQRSSEDRFRDTLRSPIPFYLRHGILIFWLRKRSGLRILCLYHPKACHCMFVLRQHSHTVCRTEIFHRCIMTTSSSHPCYTVRIADRIQSVPCLYRAHTSPNTIPPHFHTYHVAPIR